MTVNSAIDTRSLDTEVRVTLKHGQQMPPLVVRSYSADTGELLEETPCTLTPFQETPARSSEPRLAIASRDKPVTARRKLDYEARGGCGKVIRGEWQGNPAIFKDAVDEAKERFLINEIDYLK